jgi:hypothetical protein
MDLVDSNSLEWDRSPSMGTVPVHSLVSTGTGHFVELIESFLVTCSDIPLRVNVSVTCLTNSGLLPYPSLTLLVIVPRPWTPLLYALLDAPMLLSKIFCKEIQEDNPRTYSLNQAKLPLKSCFIPMNKKSRKCLIFCTAIFPGICPFKTGVNKAGAEFSNSVPFHSRVLVSPV